jgi:hypothetical protein
MHLAFTEINVLSIRVNYLPHGRRRYPMRNLILTVCVFMLATVGVQAAQIDLTVTLDGEIINGADISKITDGYFPDEEVWGFGTPPLPDRWNGENNVAFHGNTASNRDIFYFNFNGTYLLEDVKLAVDNNDQYDVEYLTSTGSWSNLFTILTSYGSAGYSMDNFTTIYGEDIKSDGDQDYVSGIDFATIETSQLRLYAYNSSDTYYSLGEFQAFGTLVEDPGSGPDPVPEPATFLLLGSGLAGLAFYRRKKK